MNGRPHIRRNRRDGAVLLAVLVCLGIASAITGVALHRSLLARRQLNHEWQLEQTRVLLDAGIRRTHRNVRENPGYVGESWDVDGALESYATARVEIEATDSDETDADSKRFKIIATIQNRDVHSFQTKRSRVITVRSDKVDTADNNAGG